MSHSPSHALLARLADLLGPKGFSTDPDVLAPWLTDWRGKYHGHAAAMLSPATTAEVAAVVGACAAEEVLPTWPAGAFARSNDLDRRISARVDAVAAKARDKIAGDGVSGWLTKRYLDAGLFFAKGTILDKAKAAIDAAAQQVNAGPPEKRSG